MSEKLSDYELVRLENIKRNEEFLKSMGLYKDPNTPPTVEERFKTAKKKPACKTNQVVLATLDEENLGPVRRSSRNSTSPAVKREHVSLSDVENNVNNQPKAKRKYDPLSDAARYFDKQSGDDDEDYIKSEDDEESGKTKRVVITPAELRAYVDSVCPEHSELISNAAIQLCAYRCAYMTIAALKNRVRAVSTGGGKKSHEKLLVVTYAMHAMGLHRLADTAAGLLRRNTGLMAVFGDSDSNSSGVKVEGGSSVDVVVKMEGDTTISSSDTSVDVVKLEGMHSAVQSDTTTTTSTCTNTNATTSSTGKRTRSTNSTVKVEGECSSSSSSSSSSSVVVIKIEPEEIIPNSDSTINNTDSTITNTSITSPTTHTPRTRTSTSNNSTTNNSTTPLHTPSTQSTHSAGKRRKSHTTVDPAQEVVVSEYW